jgi:hypothetical protein
MKYLFSGTLLIVITFVTGCQKEISSIPTGPATNDTAEMSVLKQIRVSTSPSVDFDYTFSLQYDTANRSIKVFLDDTSNTSPYDLLACTYQFNTDGYLVSSSALDENGVLKEDFNIIRTANNQIEKIIDFDVEEINNTLYNDTIFYSYSLNSNGMVVKDSVCFYPFNGQFASRSISFNTQNKPVFYQYSFDYDTLMSKKINYSTEGTLQNIQSSVDTTNISFDPEGNGSGWEKMSTLFLGKDYYLLAFEPLTSRLSYNFLSFVVEGKFETVYNPLLTMPLSDISTKGFTLKNPGLYQQQNISFQNTYTPEKRLASVSLNVPTSPSFYYHFKYQ